MQSGLFPHQDAVLSDPTVSGRDVFFDGSTIGLSGLMILWEKLDDEYDESLDDGGRRLIDEENREFAQEMIEIMRGLSPG